MQRMIKRLQKTRVLPHGALVHIGEKKTEKVRISVIDYDISNFEEKEVKK